MQAAERNGHGGGREGVTVVRADVDRGLRARGLGPEDGVDERADGGGAAGVEPREDGRAVAPRQRQARRRVRRALRLHHAARWAGLSG